MPASLASIIDYHFRPVCPKLICHIRFYMLIYGPLRFQVLPIISIFLCYLMITLIISGLIPLEINRMSLIFLSRFTNKYAHTYPLNPFIVITVASFKINALQPSLLGTESPRVFRAFTLLPRTAMQCV